jgi:hypothetical protein
MSVTSTGGKDLIHCLTSNAKNENIDQWFYDNPNISRNMPLASNAAFLPAHQLLLLH